MTEFTCTACDGEGQVDRLHLRPQLIECDECKGSGLVECDRGGIDCPYPAHCYCEAAWERSQADMLSEPPPTAKEAHEASWRERDALRKGYPI